MSTTEYRSREAREEHDAIVGAGQHFFQLLGLHDVTPPDGFDVAVEIEVAPWIANPRGGLQGGFMSAMADVVAGRAVLATLEAGQQCVTVDLTMHYLHAIAVGPARASGKIIRRGRQLAVVSVELTDAGTGDLAAVSTVTFSIITTKEPSRRRGDPEGPAFSAKPTPSGVTEVTPRAKPHKEQSQ